MSGVPSLDDLELFLAVAKELSFARAARELGVPPPTLTRRIQRLEQRLDAPLLRRSTRRVRLTDAGALLLERAEGPRRDLREALECLAEDSDSPRGRIRITLPADLARLWLASPLAAFAARHPDIRLELSLTGRLVDLVEEGFDLAIRVGRPQSATLIARRLAVLPTGLYASPSCLAGLLPLAHPRDLEAVNAIVLTGRSADRSWSLSRAREKTEIAPRGNLEADDLGTLISLVASGAGVALLPVPLVAGSQEAGRVVRVLPGWNGPEAPVYAVFLSRRMPLRLRLLLDHLREWLDDHSPGG